MPEETGSDLIRLGVRIRKARKERGFTLDELAARTGLSKGLLSKIESFRTLPSLPALAGIANALGVDMGDLVRGLGAEDAQNYTLARAGAGPVLDRDDAENFLYQAILARWTGGATFQAFLLTLGPDSRRRSVSTDGDQFVYLLQGRIEFQIGSDAVPMEAGDALWFDGRLPHVPRAVGKGEAKLLVIYLVQGS